MNHIPTDGNKKKVQGGCYRNGVRFSEVVEGDQLSGYYDERSVSDGQWLNVAQYEKDLKDKNGRCFESENGSLKREFVYENGVEKRTVRDFVDEKMIGFNTSGKKMCEGVYYGDMKSGFLCHEPMDGMDGFFKEVDSNNRLVAVSQYDETNVYRNGKCFELENGRVKRVCLYENGEMKRAFQKWELHSGILSGRIDSSVIHIMDPYVLFVYNITTESTFGVFRMDRSCYSVNWSKDTSQGVIVDRESEEMIVYKNGEQNDTPHTKEVIDLDSTGRRWEGSVKNGMPFGYGVIYDEEGRKEYEGFVMDGIRTCYGIEYYSDISKVKYEGCYYDNKRFGKGVLYDRNGVIDHDGLWKNDEPYVPQFDGNTIDNHTESIDIPNNSFMESKSFSLHSFIHSLKRIVIGNKCFGSVRLFELNGLSELESVMVGEKSFTIGSISEESKRSDGVYRIVNCPNLKSLQIGDDSFSDYYSFELNDVPSLQSIDIGDDCFYWTPLFSLTGVSE